MKDIKDYLITEETEKKNKHVMKLWSIASQYGKLFLDTVMSFAKYLDEVGEIEFDEPIQIANKEDYDMPGEVTAVKSVDADHIVAMLVSYKEGAKPEWEEIVGVNGQDVISLDDLLWLYEKVYDKMKNKKK